MSRVPIRCRLLGHKPLLGAQVFAATEQRERDGTWLAVRGWCIRCRKQVLIGSLWVQDYTARRLYADSQTPKHQADQT